MKKFPVAMLTRALLVVAAVSSLSSFTARAGFDSESGETQKCYHCQAEGYDAIGVWINGYGADTDRETAEAKALASCRAQQGRGCAVNPCLEGSVSPGSCS